MVPSIGSNSQQYSRNYIPFGRRRVLFAEHRMAGEPLRDQRAKVPFDLPVHFSDEVDGPLLLDRDAAKTGHLDGAGMDDGLDSRRQVNWRDGVRHRRRVS